MRPAKPRRTTPRPRTSTHAGKCQITRKARFPSFDAAVAAAVRVSRWVGPLRCYPCPHCKGWHLTRLKTWKDSK